MEEPVLIALKGDTVRLDVPIEGGAELEVRIDGEAVDVDPEASSHHRRPGGRKRDLPAAVHRRWSLRQLRSCAGSGKPPEQLIEGPAQRFLSDLDGRL